MDDRSTLTMPPCKGAAGDYNPEAVDENDSFSDSERLLRLRDAEVASAGQNLDKELVKASVMARLFHGMVQPTHIGRFTLIKRIGAGGMGEVYAAYDEQLDRKVAIKLVRPDADPGASQRLVREAQVLARLSHPNVVQVYEVGTIADRVFLAMEFIRGQTLRDWLGQQDAVPEPQRWRRVLDTFLAAGRGLAAAHAAGLVHRDFKPDNVLIGADGRVCVADFGLARVASASLVVGATLDAAPDAAPEAMPDTAPGPARRASAVAQPTDSLTRSGTLMGTPAYMSPEQWHGRPSDSRSDQFSFCVALYEALYGIHPFAAGERAKLRERVIAGGCKEPAETTLVPAHIWTILQRGLAAAPADRCPDMDSLLDALSEDPRQRWRRRTAAMLLLATGALIGGGGIALHAASESLWDPCAHAGDSVTAIWSPDVAAQVRDAFETTPAPYARTQWEILRPRIDAYANTLWAARQASCETPMSDAPGTGLVERTRQCLDTREEHLSVLLDELRRADASVVERSAAAVAALPLIASCEDREGPPPALQPPPQAEAQQVRAIQNALARARMQHLLGHRQQALALAWAQLVAAERLTYEPVRAEALHQAGFISSRDGGSHDDVARAEAMLNDALDLAESNRHDDLVTQIWLDLALLGRRHHTDFTLAHAWIRRALATSRRLGDPVARDHQQSRALSLRGALFHQEGELEAAERDHLEALALIADLPGVSPLARARALQELAITLRARGRLVEALSAFQQALAIQKAELGDGHPGIARLRYDMASAVSESGDIEGARKLLHQALETWTAVNGPVSEYAADVHLKLASLEGGAGNLDEAGEHARLGREMYGRILPADSPRQMYAEATVAGVAFRRERFAEALAAYERGLAAALRAASIDPTVLARFQSNIGETLVMLGRPDEALLHVAEAEAVLARACELPPAYVAGLRKSRGLALLARGEARAASAFLEQALALLAPVSGQPAQSLEYAEIQWALAQALRAAGQQDARARALAESARQFFHDRGPAGERTRDAIDTWLETAP
jgi:tetratricopeptide (TPR) repeat protein/predicted Ser/Thr protein kinase